MKLNLHAKMEIAVVAILLLASCGDNAPRRFTQGDLDRLEAANANARKAISRINDLESRVEELELKLDS